ncbi:MAG TPA: GNAT family N-acetyltransferase [Gaiellaceae bacterium]|nr:GNAT family N-acetyltransferase [Gaiellaceae bacterium]
MIEEVPAHEWDSLVPDDAYLKREYAETALLLDPGELVLLHAEGTVFPCIVREWQGVPDVTGLYGFGGPVGDAAFYGAYEEWCRERGVVTTFTWFHPRFQNQAYSRFHVEPRGGTVAWRLEGDLFERLHRHHRRAVRKARDAGLEIRVTPAPADLEPFARLYERTMAEKGATGFYYFPGEYWRALAGREWLVLFEALEGDELRAALLGLTGGGWLHYHLGASERAGGANNLLFLEAAEWARGKGFERFHLGGGVGGADDSLLQFKLRFDEGGLIESAVGKAIHDNERYRELGGAGFDGFFPSYRRAA